MFDNYVWSNGTIKPVVENGKTKGFEIKTLITYYRGIPLSMIEKLQVIIDGKIVSPDKIRFSPDGGVEWFGLDEMTTVTTYRWEYGEEGTVFVECGDELSKGEHEITLKQAIRVAYIPVAFGGERTAKVIVE